MLAYKLKNTDFVLDLDPKEKRYFLRVNDLPFEDRPREKLLKYGPSCLTVTELVAVLLNTGTKKEAVLEMSSRIIKEYGERTLSDYVDPRKMAKDLNIPEFKAAQIVACAELGRRFYEKKIGAVTIRTPKDVFDYTVDMRELGKEYLRGLYLNSHHKIIHDEVLSIGTLNSNLIHPREVFKPALDYCAAAVILVHNHPSGEAEASSSDLEITEQLVKAGKIMGVHLLDHVIVTKNDFASVKIKYD
jgi:DNA repair protein RadC